MSKYLVADKEKTNNEYFEGPVKMKSFHITNTDKSNKTSITNKNESYKKTALNEKIV